MSDRIPNDAYMTPPALAIEMCRTARYWWRRWFPGYPRTRVLEPGCGTGNILDALRDWCPPSVIRGVDIDTDMVSLCLAKGHVVTQMDFLGEDSLDDPYQLIIGNPPYTYAQPFIEKSLAMLDTPGMLVFLTRLGLLAGQRRYSALHSVHPPSHVTVLPWRPSFIQTENSKTDKYDYMICIWTKPRYPTSLDWLIPPDEALPLLDEETNGSANAEESPS